MDSAIGPSDTLKPNASSTCARPSRSGGMRKNSKMRAADGPRARDTLVRSLWHYAAAGSADAVHQPVFVRSHDFVGQRRAHMAAQERCGTGCLNGAAAGGFALDSALHAAEAEQNFLIPEHTQALNLGRPGAANDPGRQIPRCGTDAGKSTGWAAPALMGASCWRNRIGCGVARAGAGFVIADGPAARTTRWGLDRVGAVKDAVSV